MALLRVHVENMAGAVHSIDALADDATVAELKRRLHAVDADCAPSRTRLMMMVESSGDAAHTVLDTDARSLASYGVIDEATLHSFVAARTPVSLCALLELAIEATASCNSTNHAASTCAATRS